MARGNHAHQLGLMNNFAQFAILVGVNALVGASLGQERTLIPVLATDEFQVAGYTAALSTIAVFGLSKALTNYLAGTWSDRYGRKPVLIAGWLLAIPVPLLLIWAPSWSWIILANIFLGVSQGMTWSTTVVMKIDLVGPKNRGLAMGLNEAAGYAAVAVTALVTGMIAAEYGLRPWPFVMGIIVVALGLALSIAIVRETLDFARLESLKSGGAQPSAALRDRDIWSLVSFREPTLSSASHAGMVNNLNDGLAWGLFPVLFLGSGLSLTQTGVLAAVYPAVWGFGQLFTGALSDRWGRKGMIVTGMLVQAGALGLVALSDTYVSWLIAAVLLGAGTAMVYPTLLAAIGDVAHPHWRARAVGTYRLWRDGGFVVGALLSGVIADAAGIRPAIWAVAVLTALAGFWVAYRMPRPLR